MHKISKDISPGAKLIT